MKLHQLSLGLFVTWTIFQLQSSEPPKQPKQYNIPAPYFLNDQGQLYTPQVIQPQTWNNYSLQSPFLTYYLPSYSIPQNTYTTQKNLNTSEETNVLYFEHTIIAYQAILTLEYLLKQTKTPENKNLSECRAILKQSIDKYKNSDNPKTKEQLTALTIFEDRGLENLFKTLRSTPDLSIIINNQPQPTDTASKSNLSHKMPALPPANVGQKSAMPKTILKDRVKQHIEQITKK